MPGSRRQNRNIEDFVRENASLVAKNAEENPNAVKKHRHMYKCKYCDKEYDNYQALGGHRASHRSSIKTKNLETHSEVKRHECKICREGFVVGQALGGHMRKHWVGKVVVNKEEEKVFENLVNERIQKTSIVPCQPRDSSSSSSSSVSNGKEGFRYDLNLTPDENELMNGDMGS